MSSFPCDTKDLVTFTVSVPPQTSQDLKAAIGLFAQHGAEINLEVVEEVLRSVGLDPTKLGSALMRLVRAFSDENVERTLKASCTRRKAAAKGAPVQPPSSVSLGDLIILKAALESQSKELILICESEEDILSYFS